MLSLLPRAYPVSLLPKDVEGWSPFEGGTSRHYSRGGGGVTVVSGSPLGPAGGVGSSYSVVMGEGDGLNTGLFR